MFCNLAVDDLKGFLIILGADSLQEFTFPVGLQSKGPLTIAFRQGHIVRQGQAGHGQKAGNQPG